MFSVVVERFSGLEAPLGSTSARWNRLGNEKRGDCIIYDPEIQHLVIWDDDAEADDEVRIIYCRMAWAASYLLTWLPAPRDQK